MEGNHSRFWPFVQAVLIAAALLMLLLREGARRTRESKLMHFTRPSVW